MRATWTFATTRISSLSIESRSNQMKPIITGAKKTVRKREHVQGYGEG
jgi:hypothetical protein